MASNGLNKSKHWNTKEPSHLLNRKQKKTKNWRKKVKKKPHQIRNEINKNFWNTKIVFRGDSIRFLAVKISIICDYSRLPNRRGVTLIKFSTFFLPSVIQIFVFDLLNPRFSTHHATIPGTTSIREGRVGKKRKLKEKKRFFFS